MKLLLIAAVDELHWRNGKPKVTYIYGWKVMAI